MENQDYVSLYRLDLRSGRITQVKTTEEVVRRFDVDNKGQMIAYGGQSTMNSDRIYQINNRGERLLYDLATQKMHDLALGTAETWSFTMPNGDVVPGRFYLPPNFDPSRKYPMIVYYYGGTSPTARNFEGSYSLPMYAAQGYVVLTLNPSGTTGWGQEYAARHLNAWGKRTADEIVVDLFNFGNGICGDQAFNLIMSNMPMLIIAAVASTPLATMLYTRFEHRRFMWIPETLYCMGVLAVSTASLVNQSYNPFLYFRF